MKKNIGLIMRKGYGIHKDHIDSTKRLVKDLFLVTFDKQAKEDSRFTDTLILDEMETDNIDTVIHFANNKGIGLFMTFQETDIVFTQQINEVLGKESHLKSAQICRNKSLQREFLQQFDIPTVAYERHSYLKEKIKTDLSFPLIIKPATAASSSHVFLCQSQTDLQTRYESIQQSIRTGSIYYKENKADIVVEEFLPGEEVTLDGVVINGEFHFGGIHRKDTMEGPFFEEDNYTLCSSIKEERELIEETTIIVEKLGLGNSLFNVEFKKNNDGEFKVIEFSNRISGGHVYRNIRDVYAIDLVSAYVTSLIDYSQTITNLFLERSKEEKCNTCIRFIYGNGTLISNNTGEAKSDPNFVAYYPTSKVGQMVQSAPAGFDLIGLLSIRTKPGHTHRELTEIADRVEKKLDLTLSDQVLVR